ncbi:TetR/AcrR family transcriptional regulator [Ruania alba]|uniref:DNA-binding transcriptional regulator, AcrR family n=1 Tax=Ruania alba TaxID=648782 RepID=A0A1H5CC43_9MICO|nr:TetR/AcrR family transcriptional regulator [Ruania alba]SED64058.1 DNA-binding transcriptional regulator, AcrR family [Ruania alba]
MPEPSALDPAAQAGGPGIEHGAGRGRRGPYRKSAERRRRIVDAAVEVFSEQGYRGATIRTIAARAGISPSSLLHFYATKNELLWATMTHRDSVRFTGPEHSFPDRVVGQAIANEDVPHLVRLYGVLTAEAATQDHPARGYFAGRFAVLRGQYADEFEALADAGLLRPDVDPAVAAVTVVALWDGVQLQALYDPEVIRAADVLRDYFRLVLTDPGVLATPDQLGRWWQERRPSGADVIADGDTNETL